MQINLKDIQLLPVMHSGRRARITDDVYFSSKYAKYISNSKLKLINPNEGGSPEQYFGGLKAFSTSSLALGSAVHELLLQPEEFELGPKVGLPTAKKGATVVAAVQNYLKGGGLYEAIVKACKSCDYYANAIDKHIKDLLDPCLEFYKVVKDYPKTTKEVIWLDDTTHDLCERCLTSMKNNKRIMSKLHPKDMFGDKIPSYNEDAIFCDFIAIYKDKAVLLPVKMKADNWTIDTDNKVLTLNDVKTTSGFVKTFMDEGDHFDKYHYHRQMALYLDALKFYCADEYGVDDSWTLECNMLVVNTQRNAEQQFSQCFTVSQDKLEKGRAEYKDLLKRVAAYEIFGVSSDLELI